MVPGCGAIGMYWQMYRSSAFRSPIGSLLRAACTCTKPYHQAAEDCQSWFPSHKARACKPFQRMLCTPSGQRCSQLLAIDEQMLLVNDSKQCHCSGQCEHIPLPPARQGLAERTSAAALGAAAA